MRGGVAKARHDLTSNHTAKPRVTAAAARECPVPGIPLGTPDTQANGGSH